MVASPASPYQESAERFGSPKAWPSRVRKTRQIPRRDRSRRPIVAISGPEWRVPTLPPRYGGGREAPSGTGGSAGT
jgi:hypothetical protein